jgi:hypothetical protein
MTQLSSQLLRVADAYANARGLSRSRVSTIVFNAGMTLDRLADGKDITTGNYERAMAWFDQNWPTDAGWPVEVNRPGAIA